MFSDDAWRDILVYSLNFTFHRDAEPIDAPWAPPVQILQHDNEDDKNGAHFSCAVDSEGATHIVTKSGPSMYYLRIARYALEPGMPRDLGITNPDQYPQASVSENGSVHLSCPVASGTGASVDVLSSFDGGKTFNKTHSLIYNSSRALGAPRVEAPTNFGSLLPVLLLTEPTTGNKRLVSFDVEFE